MNSICSEQMYRGEMLIGKIVSGGQTGVDRVSTEAEPSCRRQSVVRFGGGLRSRLPLWRTDPERTARGGRHCAGELTRKFVLRLIEAVKGQG